MYFLVLMWYILELSTGIYYYNVKKKKKKQKNKTKQKTFYNDIYLKKFSHKPTI